MSSLRERGRQVEAAVRMFWRMAAGTDEECQEQVDRVADEGKRLADAHRRRRAINPDEPSR